MGQEGGRPVKAGDVIAEIETDKATMEVEAVDEGTLGKILVPEGTDDVAVNTPIADDPGGGRGRRARSRRRRQQRQQKAAESAPPARGRGTGAAQSSARPRRRHRRLRPAAAARVSPSRTCRKAPRWSP